MPEPSGSQALSASSAGWLVRRVAAPPWTGTFQRSPRQVKVSCDPSGLSAGRRGRSTVPDVTKAARASDDGKAIGILEM
jgi:hypothetical protein